MFHTELLRMAFLLLDLMCPLRKLNERKLKPKELEHTSSKQTKRPAGQIKSINDLHMSTLKFLKAQGFLATLNYLTVTIFECVRDANDVEQARVYLTYGVRHTIE